jgi:hypothetical protein
MPAQEFENTRTSYPPAQKVVPFFSIRGKITKSASPFDKLRMNAEEKHLSRCPGLFLIISGMLYVLCVCFPSVAIAQQPTATISELNGNVLVSIQGGGPVSATAEMELHAGDIIETQAGANVVLTLSDGSSLDLGEKTKLDLTVLAQEPETKARKSRLKLFWGKIRATLSPGHQEEGSSFEVATPNALAGVKFSKPLVEVIYDLETETTTIIFHTVEGIVENLLSRETRNIPAGSRVIVRTGQIEVTGLRQTSSLFLLRRNLLLQIRQGVSASVSSSVPSLSGVRPETSNLPGAGTRGSNPGTQQEPREVEINLDLGF